MGHLRAGRATDRRAPSLFRFRRAVVCAALAVFIPAAGAFAQAPDPSGQATFVVLLGGTRVGTETVAFTRAGAGWMVSGEGFLQAPFELSTTKFEVGYAADWQPQSLALEYSLRGQPTTVSTTFGGTTATNVVVQNGKRGTATHQISPRPVVLPNNFFGAYELLAVRLLTATPGTRLPAYIAPNGETSIIVGRITPKRVSLGDQTIELQEFALTVTNQSGNMPVELWVDSRGRLARLVMPTVSIVSIRDDLASVMAREERLRLDGDEDVFIGVSGFSLSGTLTRPASAATERLPAVVLAGAPGPQDRDHVAYGIPVFAQIADSLAKAGYMVIRYDPRGTGRSGGRSETARIDEYAEDVLGVVNWLRRRRDVDRDRIAVVGYGDAGPVAMAAAARSNQIKALALVASPGRTGREVALEQQQLTLARMNASEADKSSRLQLQTRVIDAVVKGSGWENVPDDVRAQADTAWFRSWLLFDPAVAMKRIKQPVLVLHGELDSEIPSAHAGRLESIARAREVDAARTRLQVLPGLNHLLLRAQTGTVEEYSTLQPRTISNEAGDALRGWLTDVLARR